MNTRSSTKSGMSPKGIFPRDIPHLKLYMLNLHKFIANGLKLQQIFEDLGQKYRGEYIYGKMYIAETIIYVIDTLDMVIFHLNSLTGGQNIALYQRLDGLKSRLNKSFEKKPDRPLQTRTAPAGKADDLSVMLAEIMDNSSEVSAPAGASNFNSIEDLLTAGDLLYYCYNRLLDILNDFHRAISDDASEIPVATVPILDIPLSYLQQDRLPAIEMGLRFSQKNDIPYSNPGALKLGEGIFEVLNSEYYSPFLESSYKDIEIRGMMLYSNETLVLFLDSNRFKFVITSNISDDAGGNYINLLTASSASHDLSLSSHELIGRLLDWLDFYTFSGSGFTSASIQNITRNEMEYHLNTLGKLLVFVSATGIPPSDDETIRRNLENFLENII